MIRFRRRSDPPDWLALGDASRLLGVTPGTLRRWSDAGRIHTFTTIGGHRRYRRAALERLLPADRIVRPSLVRSGMTPSRLARAYRAQARQLDPAVAWVAALDDAERDWFRAHGRSIAELLLRHLDAADAASRDRLLTEVTAEAAGYGRKAAQLGVSMTDSAEGFLHFRRPFQQQLAGVARRRGLDAASTSDLIDSSERVLDRLLVATMTAHSIERGMRRSRRAVASEGLT